jgi:hypothetical protein
MVLLLLLQALLGCPLTWAVGLAWWHDKPMDRVLHYRPTEKLLVLEQHHVLHTTHSPYAISSEEPVLANSHDQLHVP